MEKIEIKYTNSNCDIPKEMELAIDKEAYLKLKKEFKFYEDLSKDLSALSRAFCVTILIEIYSLSEEAAEIFTVRDGDSELRLYPDPDKSVMEWNMVQHVNHKFTDEYLETREFTLVELYKHFQDDV